jgi:DNA-binding CsgD family transcriptional regulator
MKGLTERQKQVIALVGTGLQLKQVAAELGVSTQAVHMCCVWARKKLNLHNQAQFISYAARAGQNL